MPRLLNIKVGPRAKQNAVSKRGGRLVVRVTAAAEDGQANAAVIEVLVEHLGISPSRLTIKRGAKSRHKVIAYT